MTMDLGLDSTKLTKDKLKQDENTFDPLVHTTASYKLLAEFFDRMQWTRGHAKELKTPVLMFQGSDDQIVVPKINEEFMQDISGNHKANEFVLLQGGRHESFNDQEKDAMFKKMEGWILSLL